MTEPNCRFCHKQLPVKRERVLITGKSIEAGHCIEAANAYLSATGSQLTLEQFLSSTSTSTHYICTKCSSLIRRWLTAQKNQGTAEEEIRSTTTLPPHISELHGPCSPQTALAIGPPLDTSSPMQSTRRQVGEDEPLAKRRKLQTQDVQVSMNGFSNLHTL